MSLTVIIETVISVALAMDSTAALPHDDSADSLLRVLHDDSGWVRVDSMETGQEVFNKTIHPSTVPAIMVTHKASVSPQALIKTIEDAGHYTQFIHDAYLERSDVLAQGADGMDVYQLLGLPIISSRHYIYRMGNRAHTGVGTIRLEWFLLPRDSQYGAYVDSMDARYGNPVYPHAMVGSWEIKEVTGSDVRVTYRLYSDPAGLIPGFLVARTNRVIAPAMVREMVREALRRENP